VLAPAVTQPSHLRTDEHSTTLEHTMTTKRARDGVRNSVEGKAKVAKGRVKDAAGGLTGDGSLQLEGKLDQAKGKIQDTVGKVQRKLDRSARERAERETDGV
jgi:uncharacterized protein YjbJ (UPF0337 family)